MLLLGPKLRSPWCTSLTAFRVRSAGAVLACTSGAHLAKEDDDGTLGAGSLLSSYQRLLERGVLLPDPSQVAAVRALQLLQDAVLQREARLGEATRPGGHPTDHGDGGGVDVGGRRQPSQPPASASTTGSGPGDTAVRGALLWGPVGSGKTVLMDLFAGTTAQRLLRELPQLQAPNHHQHHQEPHQHQPLLHEPPMPAAAPGGGPAAPAALPPAAAATRGAARRHFHEFMQAVHGRLHQLQEALPRVVARSRQGMLVYRYAEPEEDPLVTVAREWGSRTAVLCLDELHVTDVADAMILSRLFGSLMVRTNTAVVFTSNRPPRDLYKGGLSRKYFEPFVQLVDDQMVVLRVAAGVDYRRAAGGLAAEASPPADGTADGTAEGVSSAPGSGCWYVGPGAEERLRGLWQGRVAAAAGTGSGDGSGSTRDGGGGGGGAAAGAGPVEVPLAYGRTLKVPCAAGDAACFTFPQLCGVTGLRAAVDDGGALAAPDFLALSRRFREMYVLGVPQLGAAQRDEARRLVTLLDVAYDNRCRLSVAAEVSPDALFTPLLEEARRQGVNPRLGLPRSRGAVTTEAAGGQGDSAAAATATAPHSAVSDSASASAFVPAASVTAALHMRLGPSLTHGSALINTIHPSEFTGSSPPAAAFAVPGPAQLGADAPASAQGSTSAPSPGAGLQPPPQPPPQHHHHQQHHHQQGTGSSSLHHHLQHYQQQQQRRPSDLTVPPAVLAEEVLMYHRTASRLAEMCRVVRLAGADSGGEGVKGETVSGASVDHQA